MERFNWDHQHLASTKLLMAGGWGCAQSEGSHTLGVDNKCYGTCIGGPNFIILFCHIIGLCGKCSSCRFLTGKIIAIDLIWMIIEVICLFSPARGKKNKKKQNSSVDLLSNLVCKYIILSLLFTGFQLFIFSVQTSRFFWQILW